MKDKKIGIKIRLGFKDWPKHLKWYSKKWTVKTVRRHYREILKHG